MPAHEDCQHRCAITGLLSLFHGPGRLGWRAPRGGAYDELKGIVL
jgi:hypothetical protein